MSQIIGHKGGGVNNNGLVLQVDAANGKSYTSGDTTTTDTANQFIGTLTNGVTFNVNTWEFDGVNDYIDLPDSFTDEINLDTTGTVEAWIKLNGLPGRMIWHASAGVTPYSDWLRFEVLSNGKVRGYKRHHPSDPDWIVDGTTVLTTGVWYHVVLRQDGTSPKIYVNGVQDNTTFINYGDPGRWNSPSIGNSKKSNIGCAWNNAIASSPDNFFNGSIAQLKYYNRALTPDEIKQNYESQKYRYI